jgi:hypothetical protein
LRHQLRRLHRVFGRAVVVQLHGLAFCLVHKRATACGFKNAAAVLVSLEPQRIAAAKVGQQRDIEAIGADAEAAEHAAG